MVGRLVDEKTMTEKTVTKLLHEGEWAAEVEVTLLVNEDEWSPYLSVADANKLDDVRQALRRGDVTTASRMARVFRLVPLAI